MNCTLCVGLHLLVDQYLLHNYFNIKCRYCSRKETFYNVTEFPLTNGALAMQQ